MVAEPENKSAEERNLVVFDAVCRTNLVSGHNNRKGEYSPGTLQSRIVRTIKDHLIADWLMTYRGPAKGYTEALEARLLETEYVLHRIISSIPRETLFIAFRGFASSDEDMQINSETNLRIPPYISSTGSAFSSKEKKDLIQHWAEYPLDTAGNTMLWHSTHWNDTERRISERLQSPGPSHADENEGERQEEPSHTGRSDIAIQDEISDRAKDEDVDFRRDAINSVTYASGGADSAQGVLQDLDRPRSVLNEWNSQDQQAPVEVEDYLTQSSRGLNIPSEFQETFLW